MSNDQFGCFGITQTNADPESSLPENHLPGPLPQLSRGKQVASTGLRTRVQALPESRAPMAHRDQGGQVAPRFSSVRVTLQEPQLG